MPSRVLLRGKRYSYGAGRDPSTSTSTSKTQAQALSPSVFLDFPCFPVFPSVSSCATRFQPMSLRFHHFLCFPCFPQLSAVLLPPLLPSPMPWQCRCHRHSQGCTGSCPPRTIWHGLSPLPKGSFPPHLVHTTCTLGHVHLVQNVTVDCQTVSGAKGSSPLKVACVDTQFNQACPLTGVLWIFPLCCPIFPLMGQEPTKPCMRTFLNTGFCSPEAGVKPPGTQALHCCCLHPVTGCTRRVWKS